MTSSGRGSGEPRFLDVLLDEVHDAVDERVREPLLDAAAPPREIDGPARRRCP